jgi:hypothetical protein
LLPGPEVAKGDHEPSVERAEDGLLSLDPGGVEDPRPKPLRDDVRRLGARRAASLALLAGLLDEPGHVVPEDVPLGAAVAAEEPAGALHVVEVHEDGLAVWVELDGMLRLRHVCPPLPMPYLYSIGRGVAVSFRHVRPPHGRFGRWTFTRPSRT